MYLVSNDKLTQLYSCSPDYSDAKEEFTFFKLFIKEEDYLISLDTNEKVEQPGLIEANGHITVKIDNLGYKIISGGCIYGYISYPLVPIETWCFPIKVLKEDIIAVEESLYNSRLPGKVAFFRYKITYQAWSTVFKKGIMVWFNQKIKK